MDTPPLNWAVDVSTVKSFLECRFEASDVELKSLAAYAGLDAVDKFAATVRIRSAGPERFSVDGRFTARIVQASVITLDPVSTGIEEEFVAQFWPPELIPAPAGDQDAAMDRPEPLDNGKIGIGALLCEHLILAADPYPRNEGETLEWVEGGEDARGPFAALKGLGGAADVRRDES